MIRYGIDLGADHIRLIGEEDGVLFDEACMIAFDKRNRVLAIGNEAKDLMEMGDKSIKIISPLAMQSIDYEALNSLIEHMCYQYKVFRVFTKTELIFCYPSYLEKSQCDQLKQSLMELGASRVYMDQEIWMSAIGANLDLFLPVASCVLNIGSTNCDIALFSSGTMQKQASSKIAGKQINVLIGKWLRASFGIIVSDHMCEKIKTNLASIQQVPDPKKMQIHGLDYKTHQMKVIVVNENQVAQALEPLVNQWEIWIAQFISSLSEDQKDDILHRGIVCCGGTMLLKGLQRHFQNALGCPIFITDDPVNTVCQGLEILLSRME